MNMRVIVEEIMEDLISAMLNTGNGVPPQDAVLSTTAIVSPFTSPSSQSYIRLIRKSIFLGLVILKYPSSSGPYFGRGIKCQGHVSSPRYT